jgi:hypothetical protein
VTCSCANTLFGDSAGETEDQESSSTMSDLPKPSEVSADNINKPSLDELSDEHRQAYETLKKQHEEVFEALKKKCEEQDLEAFLSSSKKDRQGNITPVGNINFPPLIDE